MSNQVTTIDRLCNTIDTILNPMPKTGGTFTGNVSGNTPTSSDDSTKLATTAYVKDNLEDYVDLSSDETITGEKYFNNNLNADTVNIGYNYDITSNHVQLNIAHPSRFMNLGDLPESASYSGVYFTDHSGATYGTNVAGLFESSVSTTGTSSVYIRAIKNTDTNSTSTTCEIKVSVDADGNKITYAPTPNKYDSSTQIATTAFCNSQYNSTYVPDNIIGIEYIASPTDGRGKWRRINKFSQVVDPLPSYFNNHPIYGAINYSYVDDCSMINIPKFYFLYQKTSTGHKWWISNASFTIDGVGTSIVHPGFVYSGTEKAQFYQTEVSMLGN